MVEKHRWTGVGSQHSTAVGSSLSSENVRGRIPQNGRTSKGRRGRSYSVQSPSCSERARAREPRRGASACRAAFFSPLANSASAPHASRRLAETRPAGTPSLFPLRLLPGGRSRARAAPPQIRARLIPRCASRRLGAASGRRLNSWYFHGRQHARKRSFGLPL